MQGSTFSLLHKDIPISSYTLWDRLSPFHCVCLEPLWAISCSCQGLPLGTPFHTTAMCLCLMTMPYMFLKTYFSFSVYFEIIWCHVCWLFIFGQDGFDHVEFFCGYMWILDTFSLVEQRTSLLLMLSWVYIQVNLSIQYQQILILVFEACSFGAQWLTYTHVLHLFTPGHPAPRHV